MRITDKINFRQPKYMLPAIVYIPLIATGYFVFDMFNTEVAETQDKNLQTTEFLNPNLPGAQIKNGDGIGGKYENMAKSYGRIADYSAVDNIERDNEEEKEAYESKYTEEDLAELVRQAEEKDDAAEVADAKAREAEALEALNKALAEARLRGQAAVCCKLQEGGSRDGLPSRACASLSSIGLLQGLERCAAQQEISRTDCQGRTRYLRLCRVYRSRQGRETKGKRRKEHIS